MKISIVGQCATLIEEDKLVQNSENIYTVEFIFDESWDAFTKTAVFAVGSSNLAVLLTGNTCNIPSQCLKRAGANIQVGIYGVQGDKRKPTVWCKAGTVLPGAGAGQVIVPSPTPDIYAQIIGSLGDPSMLQTSGKTLVEAINELKQAIESGGGTGSGGESGGTPSHDETATNDEVKDVLDGIFGPETSGPGGNGSSSRPNEESPENTATDEEVGKVLNDVFG